MCRLSTRKVGDANAHCQTELIYHTGVVYNVFESVDVIALIKGGVYDDLSLTVGEALKKRPAVCGLSAMTYLDLCS